MENSEKKTVSRKVIDREVIMRKYHVHIKNFRNLKDVKVTLSPLTILTGENGSGKSTLFKALLFLKHNHDHEAAKKLKYVIDDDINLGGWEQIANDPKKPISIKITEETWGYDHEVEEIYDIDNCPFELNPTEEYEKIIYELKKDRLNDFQKSEFPLPIKVNKTLSKNETAFQSSKEYIFQDGIFSKVNTNRLNDRFNFQFMFLTPPYKVGELDAPEPWGWMGRSKYLIYVSKILIDGQEIPTGYLKSLAKLVLSRAQYENMENGIEDNNSITLNPEMINKTVKNKYYYKLNSYLFKAELDHIKDEYYDIMADILDPEIYELFPSLNSIISIGTTREIPSPRYLCEKLNETTYYGAIHEISKSKVINRSSIITHQDFIYDRFRTSLSEFEIGVDLGIVDKNEIIKIELVTKDGRRINLSESSSGTMQLLPILFLIMYNPKNKNTFLVQQPELHLHPRLQAELGNFLINSLSPQIMGGYSVAVPLTVPNDEFNEEELIELGKGYSLIKGFFKGCHLEYDTVPTHLIIETHSEHLLKKLQVLVSQGKTLQLWPERHCSGEDVKLKDALSIYYFAKDKKGNTKAIEMELDDNGFFKTETPKGFFDESLELNRQLLLGRN